VATRIDASNEELTGKRRAIVKQACREEHLVQFKRKLLMVVAAIAVSSCNASGTSPVENGVNDLGPSYIARKIRPAITSNYVYVADYELKQLVVYPANVQDPAPLGYVPLKGVPAGVVTDSTGNIYVSIIDKNSVLVFPSNSQTKLRTIKNGVQTPEQLAIDRSGNLFVANYGFPGGTVTEYPPNSKTPSNSIGIPALPNIDGGPYGLVVDSSDNIFVTVDYFSRSNSAIVECTAPAYACKYLTDGSGHVSQLLDTSGLTFTPALAAGSGSRVLFFKPPLWTLVNSITYPGSVHFLTTSSDGTMYIPLGRGEGKSPPAVQVVGTTSYTITNGIVDPVGAAAGI
jgi:hypothetical protein